MDTKLIYKINKNLKISAICLELLHVIKWTFLPGYRKSRKLLDQSRLIRFSRRTMLGTLNFIYSKKMQKFGSSIGLKNKVLDYQKIYNEWRYIDHLWNEGYYKEACTKYKYCLEKIYLSKKIDEINHAPPYLSNNWAGAFGHIGLLGIFLNAQELGIVSRKKRILPVYTKDQSILANLMFGDKLIVLRSHYKSSALEHPSQWHISERLMMIKSFESFISTCELNEQVYTSLILQNKKSSIKIDSGYELKARKHLSLLGLPQDAWFVGFHLREKLDPLDPRQAQINNYLPALREIVKNGGWIIRFGTGKMDDISGLKNIINLNSNFLHLHPYILAKSKFLLSTDGGPCAIAKSLGTPVLQTNTTSIARNIATASKGSLYLPKIWIKNGENCSYARIVNSLEGYSETNLKQKEQVGFKLRENTESEILEATKEMLGYSYNTTNGENMKKLDEIRQNFNVVGHGTIASSFLSENESWYLN